MKKNIKSRQKYMLLSLLVVGMVAMSVKLLAKESKELLEKQLNEKDKEIKQLRTFVMDLGVSEADEKKIIALKETIRLADANKDAQDFCRSSEALLILLAAKRSYVLHETIIYADKYSKRYFGGYEESVLERFRTDDNFRQKLESNGVSEQGILAYRLLKAKYAFGAEKYACVAFDKCLTPKACKEMVEPQRLFQQAQHEYDQFLDSSME